MRQKHNILLLPRTVCISVRCLRTWRHPPTCIWSPRARRGPPTKVRAISRWRRWRYAPANVDRRAIGRMQTRRCPSASEIAAICRSRARRTTPGELRHRDRLATLDGLFERRRYGPAVRVVEGRVWIVAVRLVRVEVRQRRDGIGIWVELGSRVGRGGRRVSDRTSPCCVRSGVEAGAASAVCWQGNRCVVSVEFWPLNFLICWGPG